MCTVSWIHDDAGGYRLLCNRDELRTRREAIEPQLELRHGIRFLAPIDGDRGGTWLSVNEHGVSVCLLNGACLSGDAAPVARTARSRGEVPIALADSCTAREACLRLSSLDLTPWPAFTLAIAEPGLPVVVAEWTGRELAILLNGDCCRPLVSSSYDPAGVRAFRQAAFTEAASLDDFHRAHQQGASAYSTCMHRADAQTVSWSEVRVEEGGVTLAYSGAAPCRGVPAVERRLERVA